jgi:hypothetical protein
VSVGVIGGEARLVPTLRASDAINYAGQDTGREYLSHSRIGILLACQRKYELHYERRLERIDQAESLMLGKAFQEAVEYRDPGRGFNQIMDEADEVGGSADYDRLRVNATIVKAAAQLYLDRWVPKCSRCEGDGFLEDVEYAPCPICDGTGYDQAEHREMEYRVQLRSPWTGAYSRTFDLKGYADGVTRHSNHGPNQQGETLTLTENKLVGRITEAQVKKLPLDRQVTLSCYGLWRATGVPVTGVHYRHIKKPSIKQTQKETVNQFIDRLERDYQERPDFYSHEETLYRTTEDLLRVEAELWMWAEDIRNLRRQRIYPRNTGSCDDYGGCEYVPICTNAPDHDSLYRERERHE